MGDFSLIIELSGGNAFIYVNLYSLFFLNFWQKILVNICNLISTSTVGRGENKTKNILRLAVCRLKFIDVSLKDS